MPWSKPRQRTKRMVAGVDVRHMPKKSEPETNITILDTLEALAEARAAAADYVRRTTPPPGFDFLSVLGDARLDAGWIARFRQRS